MGFSGGASGEESASMQETSWDTSSIPEWERSPEVGHGNPLQYSCWRIPWAEKTGRLQPTGSQRIRYDCWQHAHTHALNIGWHIVTGVESVQSLSCVRLFVTPWTTAHQASLSISTSKSFLKLMSIKSVMPSNHLIFCPPLLLLPSICPSIRLFSNRSGNNCKLF